MGINLYIGPPGSGKSYHALTDGLNKIAAVPDRYVVANFPIKYSKKPKKRAREEKRWIYLEDFEVKDLVRISVEKNFIGKEGHCLCIIDEAGIKFNCRKYREPDREEWIKFFALSRHFGYDFILVAQYEGMVDKQIRECMEYLVRHKCMNRFSLFSILPFKIFAFVSFWYRTGFRGKLQFGILRKRIAKRYDSMRIFNVEDVIKQLGITQEEAKELGVLDGAGTGEGPPRPGQDDRQPSPFQRLLKLFKGTKSTRLSAAVTKKISRVFLGRGKW